MLTDASGSPPKRAGVPSQPDFSPMRRSVPTAAPCSSTSPACSCSCAKSLRFGWPFAEMRFALPAKLASGTTGRGRPSPRPTLQATRFSAGSAHSAQTPEPSSQRRFRSGSETWSVSVQRRPSRAQSPNRKCSRCTNMLTSRRPAPACLDQLARGRSRRSRKDALRR